MDPPDVPWCGCFSSLSSWGFRSLSALRTIPTIPRKNSLVCSISLSKSTELSAHIRPRIRLLFRILDRLFPSVIQRLIAEHQSTMVQGFSSGFLLLCGEFCWHSFGSTINHSPIYYEFSGRNILPRRRWQLRKGTQDLSSAAQLLLKRNID